MENLSIVNDFKGIATLSNARQPLDYNAGRRRTKRRIRVRKRERKKKREKEKLISSLKDQLNLHPNQIPPDYLSFLAIVTRAT